MNERIVFIGRNTLYPITVAAFAELLCRLAGGPHRVVAAVHTCEEGGPGSLQSLAESNEIPAIAFEENDINSARAASVLGSLDPTLFLVVQYPKIFQPHLFTLPSKGCLNVHRGWPLRGGSIDQRAIVRRRSEYSVVLHKIDAGIDTGNILGIETFPLAPGFETGHTIDARATEAGRRLIGSSFVPLLGSPLPDGRAQDKAATSYAGKWKPERKRVVAGQTSYEDAELLARALHHPREEGLLVDTGQELLRWWFAGTAAGAQMRIVEWKDGARAIACYRPSTRS